MSNIVLTWVNPTTYTDGTTVASGDITSVIVSQVLPSGSNIQVTSLPGTATTYTIQNVSPGTYTYVVAAVDVAGTSAYSAPVTVLVPAPALEILNPPTNLVATLD